MSLRLLSLLLRNMQNYFLFSFVVLSMVQRSHGQFISGCIPYDDCTGKVLKGLSNPDKNVTCKVLRDHSPCAQRALQQCKDLDSEKSDDINKRIGQIQDLYRTINCKDVLTEEITNPEVTTIIQGSTSFGSTPPVISSSDGHGTDTTANSEDGKTKSYSAHNDSVSDAPESSTHFSISMTTATSEKPKAGTAGKRKPNIITTRTPNPQTRKFHTEVSTETSSVPSERFSSSGTGGAHSLRPETEMKSVTTLGFVSDVSTNTANPSIYADASSDRVSASFVAMTTTTPEQPRVIWKRKSRVITTQTTGFQTEVSTETSSAPSEKFSSSRNSSAQTSRPETKSVATRGSVRDANSGRIISNTVKPSDIADSTVASVERNTDEFTSDANTESPSTSNQNIASAADTGYSSKMASSLRTTSLRTSLRLTTAAQGSSEIPTLPSKSVATSDSVTPWTTRIATLTTTSPIFVKIRSSSKTSHTTSSVSKPTRRQLKHTSRNEYEVTTLRSQEKRETVTSSVNAGASTARSSYVFLVSTGVLLYLLNGFCIT